MNLNSLDRFCYDYLNVCDVVSGINFLHENDILLASLLLTFNFNGSFNTLRRPSHQAISIVILIRGFYFNHLPFVCH